MKKYSFILVALLVNNFCFSQQQKTTNKKKILVSIYTSTNQITNPSKEKETNTYKFSPISTEKIYKGRILIVDDFSVTSTKYIYDDYKRYRDKPLKGFLEKYDLTRWHPSSFRQPNLK